MPLGRCRYRRVVQFGVRTGVALLALVAVACSGGGAIGAPAPDPTSSAAVASATATPASRSAQDTIEVFASAWADGDWETLAGVVLDTPDLAATRHAALHEALAVTDATVVVSSLVADGARADADLDVTFELAGLGTWQYPTSAVLAHVDGEWWVQWSDATFHPALQPGRSIATQSVWPRRGRLLGVDGRPLRTDVDVVAIGVEPQRIEDQDALLFALAQLLDIDPEVVRADLEAPGVQPDWFVPVVTVRADEYRGVESAVESLPGAVTRSSTDRRGPTEGFAAHVLGTTGPITAEQLAAWGAPYDSSSIVGRSGLELVFEHELAGTPSGDIRLLDAEGAMLSVLARFPGREPEDIGTGLDPVVQRAAETALEGVGDPAALVAVDAATGEVRAVVSRPLDEFDRALAGSYPPGSTFKTVTAAAYLAGGATPATAVACPSQVTVTGRPFTNSGGTALGTVSLQTAYARSCNTAFVNVSEALPDDALRSMAEQFGFDVGYTVALDASQPSVPPPIDDAELAASAIGQGRVTASPLHMATVAAAVADGTWRPPLLVVDPPADPGAEAVPLPENVVEGLRSLMRSVVTEGTGTAISGAGGDVSGKTGSAEFGDDDPPRTHAWFIGFRDGLAFSVLVEGGGEGGAVAAPIAAAFLEAIDRGA